MSHQKVDSSLFRAAANCLRVTHPDDKADLTAATARQWRAGALSDRCPPDWTPIDQPGRPERPALVPARQLPKRSLGTPQGLAALVHAVTHIEFNAINLAWDAVQRFPAMPTAYYDDWVKVAAEEAEHFVMMRGRLRMLGFDYGDFPAHDGLWDMASRTTGDLLERMALVPRVLEARGLDVTPGMIERLRAIGDDDTADRLEIILRDEVGHVAIGSRWFQHLCKERQLDAIETSLALIRRHLRGEVRCPLNHEARRRAGFLDEELDTLEALCKNAPM